MNAQTAKPAKAKRRDCYVCRITLSIPLDMANADSLANAIKAVAAIEKGLPAGAVFKSEGTLGKL